MLENRGQKSSLPSGAPNLFVECKVTGSIPERTFHFSRLKAHGKKIGLANTFTDVFFPLKSNRKFKSTSYQQPGGRGDTFI